MLNDTVNSLRQKKIKVSVLNEIIFYKEPKLGSRKKKGVVCIIPSIVDFLTHGER